VPAKQTLFYATVEDLCEGLSRLEEACAIKYVATGLFDEQRPQTYKTYKEIENFGASLDGRKASLSTYLILEQNEEILIKEVSQRSGGVKYEINTYTVPSSITFTPSGVYQDKCIIYGTVTGVDVKNEKSKRLYKLFDKHVLRDFEKIKSFKVSPGAISWLDQGKRLTPNLKADPIMDLCR
jgi:hypothetical protein